MGPQMKVVCAWCKKHIRGTHVTGELVSHGMCEACEAKLEKELDETFPEEDSDPDPRTTGNDNE